MLRVLIAALMAIGLAKALHADPDPGHLVTLNTRTFDLGIEVAKMRRDPDFVPMNEIDWLKPILDADPALGPTVFHIEMAHPSIKTAARLWEWGEAGKAGTLASRFRYTSHIPERFQLPGFETRSYHENGQGSVVMIPTDPSANFSVSCDLNPRTDALLFCVLYAAYPPDPLIFLKARLYHPAPQTIRSAPLHAIAARMREIASCLDVTVQPLDRAPDGLPKLQDCQSGPGA
ncbi:hypothetical protein SAMN04488103_104260 [Gemmobacter aquatilis]|uniref:Uncharacterized protein n=1 Tax=Gemmobacter aquatilis TaxID=933059 RepID=A0A1H8FTL7_9RHOB|nr:hypothetical protein [Gemmobacter aquatilis]SEN35022.1 hypothetical protein SAMN04488103_104260 [Gemmobacter aquatilis]